MKKKINYFKELSEQERAERERRERMQREQQLHNEVSVLRMGKKFDFL